MSDKHIEHLPMRRVFGDHLVRLGEQMDDLVVLDADTSNSTQTKLFGAAFPDRFINCGVAEANMVSVAAGIASAGMRPVVSAFAFLLAMRASDQIRSQIAYSRLPVVLAGGYAGLSDFADGGSHQSISDLSFFLSMPSMTVVCPGDARETELSLEAALAVDGPVYLRLSRAEVLYLETPETFSIGKAFIRQEGDDVALVCTGHILERVLEAGSELHQKGINARVIDMHTVKPLDVEVLQAAAQQCGCIVTCEEHNVIAGLGSMVASYLARECPVPIRMIGIQDLFGQSGRYADLQTHYGLSPVAIVEAAEAVIKQKEKCTTI